jgi:hypothetical protein
MAVLQRLQAAAGQLVRAGFKGQSMSSPDLKNELNAAEVEPLLPIEKKLIGWSLGLGLFLLAILIAFNHFVPIKL